MTEISESYREQRERIGKENSDSLQSQGGNFRPKLRLAFDNMVYQYCANERLLDNQTLVEEGQPWAGMRTGNVETVLASFPQNHESHFIYAICELARRKDVEIIELPVVSFERTGSPERQGYFEGSERLDFQVPYVSYPVYCSRMGYVSSRSLTRDDNEDMCEMDVANYTPLINHLIGTKQKKDVRAFIQADIANADVFVTLDKKFINPFRDIEKKLRANNVRTLVMLPSEFCNAACLKPIPIPPPNPRQAMGGPPPNR